MERRKEENIGDVILRYLRQSQLETPLNEYRLMQSWGQVVGDRVSRLTSDLRIYNQKLYVHIGSPIVRSDIQMRKSEIVRNLNASIKAQVIVDIVLT